MRILVTTIPFNGMKVQAPLELEPLNARLAEGGDEVSVVFEEPPIADLTFTRTFGGVHVEGSISGDCKQSCATCADPIAHPITAPISWVLQSSAALAGGDDTLDDPGVLRYEGDHIDLEEPLQEALILILSPFWHPPRDAHEACVVCKRDCSMRSWGVEETKATPGTLSLGELLQGALVDGKRRPK